MDDRDVAYLDVEQRQLEKRRLEPGDIIIEKSGGGPKQAVGRVAYFDKVDGTYSFSNFTSTARVRDRREVHPRYLLKFLDWCYVSGITEKMQSHSTGIRNLDFGVYKAIEIPLPPLEEQRRIVAVLDEAFAAIATATAKAEKNLANAREFVDAERASVFRHAFQQFGSMTVGSTSKIVMGQAPPSTACNKMGAGTPFVKAGEFGTERPLIREWTTDPKKLAQVSDVLICVVGATCGKINLGADCAIGRSVAAIRPDPRTLDQRYMYHFMATKVMAMREGSLGSAQTVISREMIQAIHVPAARLNDQLELVKRLDRILDEADNLENKYKRKISTLAELKQSLLRRAFAGDLAKRELIDA